MTSSTSQPDRPVDAPPRRLERTSAAIRAIWERRRDEIVGRVDAIDDAAAALVAGALDEPTRAAAHGAAHQLAGSAGTFGFARAGELARELERALEPVAEIDAAIGPRLAGLALALRAELDREPDRTTAASPSPCRRPSAWSA